MKIYQLQCLDIDKLGPCTHDLLMCSTDVTVAHLWSCTQQCIHREDIHHHLLGSTGGPQSSWRLACPLAYQAHQACLQTVRHCVSQHKYIVPSEQKSTLLTCNELVRPVVSQIIRNLQIISYD